MKMIPPKTKKAVKQRVNELKTQDLSNKITDKILYDLLHDSYTDPLQKGLGRYAKTLVHESLEDNVDDFLKGKNYNFIKELKSLDRDDEFYDDKVEELNNRFHNVYADVETDIIGSSALQVKTWNDSIKLADTHYMQFLCVADDKTDEECLECDGTTLPMDDPWWDEHTPLLHYNCRCTTIMVDKDEAEETENPPDVDTEDGLANNPAKTGKIFDESHTNLDIPDPIKKRIDEQL